MIKVIWLISQWLSAVHSFAGSIDETKTVRESPAPMRPSVFALLQSSSSLTPSSRALAAGLLCAFSSFFAHFSCSFSPHLPVLHRQQHKLRFTFYSFWFYLSKAFYDLFFITCFYFLWNRRSVCVLIVIWNKSHAAKADHRLWGMFGGNRCSAGGAHTCWWTVTNI